VDALRRDTRKVKREVLADGHHSCSARAARKNSCRRAGQAL